MGKWTPDYVDDVLHYKMKNLVNGAIKRAALEKTEPTITYENFVNDLDIGDSFTTSLVDILVKELAERRTRPCQNDKRLIADRSAKSLRLLATPLRVYHGRSVGRHQPGRRTATLSDYLTIPPVELDTEEDEDMFESIDNASAMEGVRTNSDLYEAYINHGVSFFRSPARSPSPSAEDAQPSTSSQLAPVRHGAWTVSSSQPGLATSLTRHPSIRRPVRSRTVDFNEFSLRRRTAARENQSGLPEGEEADNRETVTGWTRNPQTARRFFPFARTRRHEMSDYTWDPQTANGDGDAWFDMQPLQLDPLPMDEFVGASISDERARSVTPRPVLPRLRRGGLRAPESILSRHASPARSSVAPDNHLTLPSPPRHAPDDRDIPGEPTSYPTPSTEPESLP